MVLKVFYAVQIPEYTQILEFCLLLHSNVG